MKYIYYKATLVYYDGPQVFEARDKIGGHYIAISIASSRNVDDFLIVGVSPEELRHFHLGSIDLRELILRGERSEWYKLDSELSFDEPMALKIQRDYLSDSDKMLPNAGFYMHDDPTDVDIIKEARERNNSILQITTEPRESIEDHRMAVDTYTELLQRIQSLVQHTYRSLLSGNVSKNMDNKNACSMNVVVPASAGSFRVVLESAKGPDLLGDIELTRALEQLDLFFDTTDNPERTIKLLTKNRGRLAHSYLKFMEFLSSHDIGMKYSWADPSSKVPSRRSISTGEAALLAEKLSEINNLSPKVVSFEGTADKGDGTNKTWRLHTDQGRISGSVREDGPTLNGLKIGTRYRFTCEEETFVTEATGAKKRTFFLTKYEPI